jgi:hypothetical protein
MYSWHCVHIISMFLYKPLFTFDMCMNVLDILIFHTIITSAWNIQSLGQGSAVFRAQQMSAAYCNDVTRLAGFFVMSIAGLHWHVAVIRNAQACRIVRRLKQDLITVHSLADSQTFELLILRNFEGNENVAHSRFEVWGLHGGDYEQYRLLGCDAVWLF